MDDFRVDGPKRPGSKLLRGVSRFGGLVFVSLGFGVWGSVELAEG